jgi:hypothetical protein
MLVWHDSEHHKDEDPLAAFRRRHPDPARPAAAPLWAADVIGCVVLLLLACVLAFLAGK